MVLSKQEDGERQLTESEAWAYLHAEVDATIAKAQEERTRATSIISAMTEFKGTLDTLRGVGVPVDLLVARARDGGEGARHGRHMHNYLVNQLFNGGGLALNEDAPATAVTTPFEQQDVSRPTSNVNTAQMVASVVNEVGHPLKSRELVAAVRERGLVDPAWRTPAATIAQAGRRAARAELIVQLPDKRFAPLGTMSSTASTDADGNVKNVEDGDQ